MIKQILRDAYWRRRHEKNDILLQTRYFQAHVLNVCSLPPLSILSKTGSSYGPHTIGCTV